MNVHRSAELLQMPRGCDSVLDEPLGVEATLLVIALRGLIDPTDDHAIDLEAVREASGMPSERVNWWLSTTDSDGAPEARLRQRAAIHRWFMGAGMTLAVPAVGPPAPPEPGTGLALNPDLPSGSPDSLNLTDCPSGSEEEGDTTAVDLASGVVHELIPLMDAPFDLEYPPQLYRRVIRYRVDAEYDPATPFVATYLEGHEAAAIEYLHHAVTKVRQMTRDRIPTSWGGWLKKTLIHGAIKSRRRQSDEWAITEKPPDPIQSTNLDEQELQPGEITRFKHFHEATGGDLAAFRRWSSTG